MDKPLYSIIIPHYDIPDLLRRCLRSIPVSEDIQVIVVDDNSPNADTYLEIFPELSRPNMEFIRTTKGGGAGYARNVGLDYAKGKWLLFADADDYFEQSIWDRIDKIVDNELSDVIYFKCNGVYEDEMCSKCKRGICYNKLIDNFLNKKKFAEQQLRISYVTPWGKLFRSEFVKRNNLRFENLMVSNDVMFVTKAGTLSRRITAYSILMYNVTSRPNSLTTTKSIALLKCRFDVAIRKHKYIKSLDYPIVDTSFLSFWRQSFEYGIQYFIRFFFLILGNRVDFFSALLFVIKNRLNKRQ